MIRKLEKKDYKQFINLMNNFREIGTNIDVLTFNKLYDDIFKKNKIFIIEEDKKIIATAKLIIEQKFIHNLAKYGYIEDVIVNKKYRKRGYGKKIIEYIVNYCKKKNFFKITLTCNKNLINFYKKNNFEVYQIHMSQLL